MLKFLVLQEPESPPKALGLSRYMDRNYKYHAMICIKRDLPTPQMLLAGIWPHPPTLNFEVTFWPVKQFL